MTAQQFYRIPGLADNNLPVKDRYLVVNCTGRQVMGRRYIVTGSVRQDYYLLYLTQGRLDLHAGSLSSRLLPGDAVVIPPDTPYSYDSGGESVMVYYWVHFSGYGVEELLDSLSLKPCCVLRAGFHESVTAAFDQLFHFFCNRDPWFSVDTSQKLGSLLATLARSAAAEDAGAAGKPSGTETSLRYLHEHPQLPVTPAALAKMENLSLSRYRAVFTQALGIPPQEYILVQKMNTACDLLRNTHMSVAEISQAVGYDDQRYFSRLFKKRLSVSPGQYRRRDHPTK